ncbi:MAG: hypothetical protein EOP32_18200 [Rhodococcus sp. (in: high G+C Gram-positive bacteria)]|nr:MAG: hypothetical protein EOP32_18200 [Rhodococcus sp. (in: high G+C Gram-positive bacteria)]
MAKPLGLELGQGKRGLQDRQVVAVAGGPIGRGERMRGVGPATCAAAHRYPMAPTGADRLHRRGDGIVGGVGPSPNGNGIRIWGREKSESIGWAETPERAVEAGLPALGRDDPDYRFDPIEAQPEAARITAMFREVDRFPLGW